MKKGQEQGHRKNKNRITITITKVNAVNTIEELEYQPCSESRHAGGGVTYLRK